MARGFGEAAGAADPTAEGPREGAFERNPTIRLLGFPIAGGGLTARGQAQQAAAQRIQAF